MRLLQENAYGHLFQKLFKVECYFFELCDRFLTFGGRRSKNVIRVCQKSLTPSVDFQLLHSRSQKMHKFGQHVLLAAESAFDFFHKTKTEHKNKTWLEMCFERL